MTTASAAVNASASTTTVNAHRSFAEAFTFIGFVKWKRDVIPVVAAAGVAGLIVERIF